MIAVEPTVLLLPLILTLVGGLAALGAEPFLSRAAKHAWLPWVAALALLAAGVAQVLVPFGHAHGLFVLDSARQWLSLAVLAATLLSIAGLQQTLSRDDYPGGEPYALTLFAAAGVLVMVLAADLLALFIGLEIASLAIYALVGLRRDSRTSNEGLFKYFVMGAVFSAVFLYGIALTYGATGGTRYGLAVVAGREHLLLVGHALLFVGLLFKVGAVPFHFWSPDAYTGAPSAVTGFMGAVIKVGGFTALGALWLNLIGSLGGAATTLAHGPLALDATVVLTPAARDTLQPFALMFLVVGLLSIVLGNFSALKQTNARRLIAFSSVAHAGYMLLALALPQLGRGELDHEFALGSLWFYLVGYAIATAGALAALAALSGKEDANDSMQGLAGQGRAAPFYGLVLTVFVASFAGVPPTVGFLGKFLVFADLVAKGYVVAALFAMLMAVVGATYYLRLLVTIWAGQPKEPAHTGSSLMGQWTLAAAAIAVVVLIAWPNALINGKVAPHAISQTAGAALAERAP